MFTGGVIMKKQVNAAKLAAFAGAAAVGGFIYLIAPGKIRKKQKSPFQNRNFAHRGLHKRDKSVPENSLAAFERAASYGYGIELDVQLSKDGQVVVFHDDTLNRVCGVDARVDSKTLAELQPLSGYYAVPFLSDLDYVARVDSLLRGRTLYLRTSTWRRRDGSFETGLRYVPVTVESVTTGDAVYPFYVAFDQDGRHSGVMMSSPTSAVRNVTFDKLFSFSDIRSSYKHISNENWSLIVRGQVAVGMTKEECTLSLGAPQSVDRVPTHGGLLERWVYDNGVYLVFADGILERFRQ